MSRDSAATRPGAWEIAMPRVMEVTSALGDDVLLFRAMRAQEELSRLSEYRLELLSEKGDVNLDKLLGTPMAVTLENVGGKTRYFNGYVTRMAQGGRYGKYHRYLAVVRPWLWFLTRTADCRIFQDQSVEEILKTVFEDHEATADFTFELAQRYGKWNYCVQYRETDFNFVSRLMEQEGIYYYFRHAEKRNTLVLTDASSQHQPVAGYKSIPYFISGPQPSPEEEYVSSWEFSREIQPGIYVHDDYDLVKPSVELLTRKAVTRPFAQGPYEIYDYPGEYSEKPDGEHWAEVRLDELGSDIAAAHASTGARGVTVGASFTLEGFPRVDQNREHVVVSTTYDLRYGGYEGIEDQGTTSCQCDFVAMSTVQQFRPRRSTPKPFVQGPQTAIVVGPDGEEIFTDEYGRVKVQFHWDRLGKKNENSSCWIRVSHPWAGTHWGTISTPRIGQEVIVDFLEGDPDQPIITGRVYNHEQMPPYDLPANKTQSGMKSRSSLGGTPDNFNEIRFEDLKGAEQLFIHAEKNQDIEVENDETHWVGHDRKKTIDHDETTHVKHDRTETVDNNETITIHGNRTETVDKNETITVEKNRTESVGENEKIDIGKDQAITIGGKKTLSVGKAESIRVGDSRTDDVGKDERVSIGKNRQVQVGDNDTLQVGKKLVVEVGDQITIQTGAASITMKKDGTITIKGKDITLDGSGKINVKAGGNVTIKGSKINQN